MATEIQIGQRPTLTVKEVSAMLRMGIQQTYTAVRCGDIPSIRIGRRYFIPRAQLERMLTGAAADRCEE